MRIDMVNSDVTIGAVTNPQVQIDLAKVILEEWTRTGANDEIITQTLSFVAYYSVSDAKMVSVKLVNTQVAY